MGFLKKPRNT
jgi:hypothetical protein